MAPLPKSLLALVLLAFLAFAARGTLLAQGFPPESPEHQALTSATPWLADEDFSLREDYWKGLLTPRTGRAVRLQFFKRNTYRLFLGVSPDDLPRGAKLHLAIYDGDNEEVAAAAGKPDEAALALHLEGAPKSGLFLVLMRIEAPPGPFAEEDVPAVLFYGWK
jgi:hypothetical protein